MLAACRATLNEYPGRYFSLIGDPSLFVWLQSARTFHDPLAVRDKASAAALAANAANMIALLVTAEATGSYVTAERFDFDIPTEQTPGNARIYEDARRMLSRQKSIKAASAK